MSLEQLNKDIEANKLYQFLLRHKRMINIIQGIIVILLLIGINNYLFKDHAIKKQIRDHCGYTDYPYKCICEKTYVDKLSATGGVSWKMNVSFLDDLKRLDINSTNYSEEE